jgi:F-type H+-transporting ATPase subunit c
MNSKLKAFGILVFFLILFCSPLLAQEQVSELRAMLYKWALIIGGAAITLAAAAGAYCQAKSISSACEGISRNPGGAPTIRFILIFGLVLIETLVIYTLLISIMIINVQWGNYT